jgi:hypothetical protein
MNHDNPVPERHEFDEILIRNAARKGRNAHEGCKARLVRDFFMVPRNTRPTDHAAPAHAP